MRNKRRNVKISILKCSQCGKEMFVPRKMSNLRAKNHIKDMYCPFCKRKQKFIESGDYR